MVPSSSKIWYLCDPIKNVECRKRSCVHNTDSEFQLCDRTCYTLFAVLDGEGNPIIAKAQLKQQAAQDAPEPP